MSNPKDYTVLWISAIATEYTAAQAFLDKEHDAPASLSPGDTNHYVLGEIAKHNVVLTTLSAGEYGVGSAANVITNVLNNFPNIRVGLMVGVGGGAPSLDQGIDIRLGDVVVSTPDKGSSGVYQYDFGKAVQGCEFKQTGFLNQPGTIVRGAVTGLKSRYNRKGHRLGQDIGAVLQQNPMLEHNGFARPAQATDVLYKSDILHMDANQTCRECCGTDPSKLHERKPRGEWVQNPAIHYGLIASANTLVKNALFRDELAKKKGILCFEMEAAGLMNRFPCLVVRGICDYSDSHKNKDWQGYAAMTAAAYAKDLLSEIRPTQIESEERLVKFVERLDDRLTRIDVNSQRGFDEAHSDAITRWLNAPDPSMNHNEANRRQHPGTGSWFLGGDAFLKWKQRPASFLWLHGMSGCGKTVLASAIIEHLIEVDGNSVAYFYFDCRPENKQKTEVMLRSILAQLYHMNTAAKEKIDYLHARSRNGGQQLNSAEIREVFESIVRHIDKLWIILDALDESDSVPTLIRWIRDIREFNIEGLRLLVTSRTEKTLDSEVRKWLSEEELLEIPKPNVNQDIYAYVQARVEGPDFRHWQSHLRLKKHMQQILADKADGMFRWTACQLDVLTECKNKSDVEETLTRLPSDLEETYGRMLVGIQASRQHRAATIILQLLLWSTRTLSVAEVNDAIIVQPGQAQGFDPENRFFDIMEVIKLCSSLVTVVGLGDTPSSQWMIQFAHSSVKEFLVSTKVPSPLREHLNEQMARAALARICLTYVLSVEHDDSVRASFPFSDHALLQWTHHANHIKSIDHNLVKLVMDLLQNKRAAFVRCWKLTDQELAWRRSGNQEPQALSFAAAYDGLLRPCKLLLEGMPRDEHFQTALHRALVMAALRGNSDIVQCLLETRGHVEEHQTAEDLLGRALVFATMNCHEGIVKLLIPEGVNLNYRWKPGTGPALFEALSKYFSSSFMTSFDLRVDPKFDSSMAKRISGNTLKCRRLIELLLKHGADANVGSFSRGTPLYTAVREGHFDLVKLLLDHNADPNVKDDSGHIPLMCAVENKDLEVVKLLLTHGADANLGIGKLDEGEQHVSSSPLLTALTRNSSNIVRLMIAADMDVSAVPMHYSLLEKVSGWGFKSAVKKLLEQGFGKNRNTLSRALISAALRSREEICSILIGHGAEVNLALKNTIREGDLKSVKALIIHVVDTNVRLEVCSSALRFAVTLNPKDTQALQLLIDLGADVNQGSRLKPLQLAVKHGSVIAAECLLRNGADVNAHDNHNSVLALAIAAGQEALLNLLLQAGAVLKDFEIQPSLSVAERQGFLPGIRLALEHGAKIESMKNPAGALRLAHQELDRNTLRSLLVGGARVETVILHDAITRDQIDVLQEMIDFGVNFEMINPWNTVLILAARQGKRQIAQMSLEQGADPNAVVIYDSDDALDHLSAAYGAVTALGCAVASGDKEVVQLLLERGADVNDANIDSEAICESVSETINLDGLSLGSAAQAGDEEIVQMLIENGAEVNAMSHLGTALNCAIGSGHNAIVQILLERGADLDAVSDDGVTSLGRAAAAGDEEIVQILIENGAEVNAMSHLGTALNCAIESGHNAIVRILLERGADLDAVSHDGLTALGCAVKSHRKEIAQMLLERGANINFVCGKDTALSYAVQSGDKEIIQMMLDRSPDLDVIDPRGTALHCATRSSDKQIVQMLIDGGADINAVTSEGTALCSASFLGRKDMVQILLEHGADIHAIGPMGSALQYAICSRDPQMVLMLIERGANLHADGPWGPNLSYAAGLGATEIARILMEHGANVDTFSQEIMVPNYASQGVGKGMLGPLSESVATVDTPEPSNFPASHNIAPGAQAGYRLRPFVPRRRHKPWYPVVPTNPGSTALQIASEYGQMEVVRQLIGHGANINATSSRGSALYRAARSTKAAAIVWLRLESGAAVDAHDNDYNSTPLQAAAGAQGKSLFTVLELLRRGADVNASGQNYGSALMLAAQGLNKETARILLWHGASIETAIQDARRLGRPGTTDRLLALQQDYEDFSSWNVDLWSHNRENWESGSQRLTKIHGEDASQEEGGLRAVRDLQKQDDRSKCMRGLLQQHEKARLRMNDMINKGYGHGRTRTNLVIMTDPEPLEDEDSCSP